MNRNTIHRLLDPRSKSVGAIASRWVLMTFNVVGVVGLVLTSVPGHRGEAGEYALFLPTPGVFIVEYALRLWSAPEAAVPYRSNRLGPSLNWALTPMALVDLAAVAVPVAAFAFDLDREDVALTGVIWVFKLARYSPGLAILWRVIKVEAQPLSSVLFAFLVVLLCAAVLGHLLEREVQPERFGTVPDAMWWTIVTLTTTGYGDAVPHTLAGRIVGAFVMVCGIGVFAMWAGIIATGFSHEMRRREHLRNWEMVARVPLFSRLTAAAMAELVRRLKRSDVAAGTILVRRGDKGDCMYFIADGKVVIQVEPEPVFLTAGAFFGELALITGQPRSATAVAATAATLLILDIVDFREITTTQPELAEAIQLEARRRLALLGQGQRSG